jgi:hypothetical protein
VVCKISKYRTALRQQGNTARDALKQKWLLYRINAEQVSVLPFETLEELADENQQLRQCAEESQEKLEDQSSELFNLLAEHKRLQQNMKTLEKDARMEHHGKA